jgi:hypothetical protein
MVKFSLRAIFRKRGITNYKTGNKMNGKNVGKGTEESKDTKVIKERKKCREEWKLENLVFYETISLHMR